MRIEYTEQATLDGATRRIPVRHRFDPPVAALRQALEAVRHECWACGDNGYAIDRERAYNVRPVEVYDDPWATEPDIIWCHDSERRPVPYDVAPSCMGAIESGHLTDFHYFMCDACYRTVIVRCPRNGWHSYARIINECEQWCLACVEDTLRAEGIAGFPAELEELFESGRLFGMFFNDGDLEGDGWAATGYRTFVNNEESAIALATKVRRLHGEGRLVIIGYESLAIGGSEGYVTLFSKEREPGQEGMTMSKTHIPATDTDTLGEGMVSTLCGATMPGKDVAPFLRRDSPANYAANYTPSLSICTICAAQAEAELRSQGRLA